MHVATIRFHETVVISLLGARIDAEAGGRVLSLVETCMADGAKNVVLDLGPRTVIDFAGAAALGRASATLGGHGRLRLAGLSSRARARLRSLRLTEDIVLVEWWAHAVDPEARMPRAA
jgi:anti-anti-sigma regulatory factor